MVRRKNNIPSFENDPRWLDVKNKNPNSDGHFVYGIQTTGIYCRPTCPARTPDPDYIEFFDSCELAERHHYRACKRCKPNGESNQERDSRLITKACRIIEQMDGAINLEELSKRVAMSPSFFHRKFKKITGVTPKQFSTAIRIKNMQHELVKQNESITDAIYNSGFNSGSRFYAATDRSLGMTPGAYREGGKNTKIQFAIAECSLGSILVARSPKGICAISFGDDPTELLNNLQDKFPNADLIGGDTAFENIVARVIEFVENPNTALDLPLDIQGTAFQQRVWKMLLTIPAGTTVSYTELAEMIGSPRSVRAVANACGQNSIAVAIPCHRVVKLDGNLSGYRWGIERKRQLLDRETEK
ncbi:bifunctional DNA-binding transcriptional regulator/O6-methylguanine-DNA methyltransferase Ada [Pragia fontium]|uniref:bifunctional DNA-binding transcriptional regulator/O6-methylguanine-DNA methyltransferase Ada n=1 Tax=Pragia fontium TaxID=82985 RepID=UPI00064A3E30|nr:bifunctional DNA-binding transcriptional regulator/O6-methylguanine-DNA methyltransferase Ada [Pragia fontium]AKJ42317.1 6-O-methylguanine DNA methyltransferase [Pragia fontium]